MALIALGPLHLTHEDLWRLAWGEVEDLIYAWRYKEYLESQKRAQLASWIANFSGNLKYPVKVNDLVGYWADGKILTKRQYHDYLKEKVIEKRKGGVSRG